MLVSRLILKTAGLLWSLQRRHFSETVKLIQPIHKLPAFEHDKYKLVPVTREEARNLLKRKCVVLAIDSDSRYYDDQTSSKKYDYDDDDDDDDDDNDNDDNDNNDNDKDKCDFGSSNKKKKDDKKSGNDGSDLLIFDEFTASTFNPIYGDYDYSKKDFNWIDEAEFQSMTSRSNDFWDEFEKIDDLFDDRHKSFEKDLTDFAKESDGFKEISTNPKSSQTGNNHSSHSDHYNGQSDQNDHIDQSDHIDHTDHFSSSSHSNDYSSDCGGDGGD